MLFRSAPGLQDTYGDEFEALYQKYEKEGRGRTTIKAQALWYKIIEAQIEVGVPYMLYKVCLIIIYHQIFFEVNTCI